MLNNRRQLPEQLEGFLDELCAKGRSELTAEGYGHDLMRFFSYLFVSGGDYQKEYMASDEKICRFLTDDVLEATDAATIREYLQRLHDTGVGDTAVMRNLSSIRMFFRYLEDRKVITSSPAERIQGPRPERRKPKCLDTEDAVKLLDAPYRYRDEKTAESSEAGKVYTGHAERDACILAFALNLGLRRSEICALDREDVSLRKGTVHVKGSRERTLPLNESCLAFLSEYLRVRPKPKEDDCSPLFISQKLSRMSSSAVYRMVKKYAIYVGLNEDVAPQILRHTCAHLMLEKGNPAAVQHILGRTSFNPESVYREVSFGEETAAIDRIPVNCRSYSRLNIQMVMENSGMNA